MLKILENIPENDPLVVPEKKAAIDEIIAEYRDLPGATMVVFKRASNQGRFYI